MGGDAKIVRDSSPGAEDILGKALCFDVNLTGFAKVELAAISSSKGPASDSF